MKKMKENSEKLGCTWSFDDDPFYVAMKITWLRLQKKFTSNPKDKEAMDKEIEKLKNKGNVIK